MKTKVDICNKEWCNMVFEGKNKDYGAYSIRTHADIQKIKSLFISLSLAISVLLYPLLSKKNPIELFKVTVFEPTKLADLPIDPPKELAIPKPPELPKPSKAMLGFMILEITNNETSGELPTQEAMKNSKIAIGPTTTEGDPNADPSEFTNTNLTGEGEKVFVSVEKMPQFPGGTEALIKFLKSNLRYPETAWDNRISGTVYIQFVVYKTGEIRDAKIVRGLDDSCNEEAMRIIKKMPYWTPGMQNGTAVSVIFTIPISYQINKEVNI